MSRYRAEIEVLAMQLYKDSQYRKDVVWPTWLQMSVGQRNGWRIRATDILTEEGRFNG